MSDSETLYLIRGVAHERKATVEVRPGGVSWKARAGRLHPTPEEFELEKSDLTVFGIRYVGWSGASFFGLLLAGLAVVWQVYQTVSLPVSVALGIVGAGGVLLRMAFPLVFLTLRTQESAWVLRVERGSIETCEQAARFLQFDRPELAGQTTSRILPLLTDQLGALFKSGHALRAEYRQSTQAGGTPAEEQIYVKLRRRLSLWFFAWMVLIPIGGAVAVQSYLPPLPWSWWLVRVGLWVFLLFVVCLAAQAILLPWIVRRLGGR